MTATANDTLTNLLDTEQVSKHLDTFIEMTIGYGPRVVLAIIVLIAGLWVIGRFVAVMKAGMERGRIEPTLSRFLGSLVSVGLKALLFISVASMIGIATTSFIAVLGAAGLAVGLALQGSLGNFAGGVLILAFRPFRVGDFIESQGIAGTVLEIQIFNTLMKTPDNKRIVIPNGALSNGIITNFSTEGTRRVDLVFSIGYGDDIARAKAIIRRVVSADTRVFSEPEPLIVVGKLSESSVDITTRVWANSADYWPLYFHLLESVKIAFDAEGVTIPFPQRDVHIYPEVKADGQT